ncbi:MAG: arsenite methyltransferase [Chloroflexi bacterium]|nr:arsenite methyltransferase [Chloroflexota bacterium]
MKEAQVKKAVREGYARIAKQGSSCCSSKSGEGRSTNLTQDISRKIGYSQEELEIAPEGANLGLGCGNPVAMASLREGETVLDLGSGAGFDCFLAARKVGGAGRVIGVDMTPEMIEKARENAWKGDYRNVEFRLGEIEYLPVADNSVDAVISNCVINLSPDKKKVFQEAFRVLRPGGRIMVSDIVLLKAMSEAINSSMEAYVGCIAGAAMKPEYIEAISAAGFQEVKVIDETSFPVEYMANDPTAQAIVRDLAIPPGEVRSLASSIISIKVHGIKPEG